MLPDWMREDLADRVARRFQSLDAGLRKAALWLQDAGHADEDIMSLLGEVWNAGYADGYNERNHDG